MDTLHYSNLGALLKKDGYSLTKPRKIVFDLLFEQEPQGMQVLVKRAERRVNRATVYRTVELFERLGITHRLNIGWKYKIELSDVFHTHHHHFFCTRCNKTFSLPPSPMLETMIDSYTAQTGYYARGHSLEISGLCENCQNQG